MKIIASTKGDGLIAKTSEYEIALIHGFTGIYDDGWKKIKSAYEKNYNRDLNFEGMEIDVSALATKVQKTRISESEIKRAVKTFRDMADALEMAWPSLVKSVSE